uniref:DUF3987 domain-containing protein n=3 Tax=viral metagenome TaxID=1070528 RepID=A0A6M3IPF0_9ZZZZ
MARKSPNWLSTLHTYVEETESPRHFWFWAGLFCIGASAQRKVWLPFGLETIYPNLFVMFVAKPGEYRKAAPVSFAKRILTDAQKAVFADSPTRRSILKFLDELSRTQTFYLNGKPKSHCSASLISKELSSFFAIDPKSLVELLTDLYDPHDEWEYKTSEKGTDKLYGNCLGSLFATTPEWISLNLPEGAIGGGFTSRFVLLSADARYKSVPIPPQPDESLYASLLSDLHHIGMLQGEFIWEPGGKQLYETWYETLPQKIKDTRDERLHGYIARIHAIMLKTAMCLRLSYSDDLILGEKEVGSAIRLVESVLANASTALSAQGRNPSGLDMEKVMVQLRTFKKIPFKDLMRINYRNTSKMQLDEILAGIEAMGHCQVETDTYTLERTIIWLGGADGKGGVRR